MNQKILSVSQLDQMELEISNFYKLVSNYYTKFDEVLKCFENQEVVQSFYNSGFLGSEQKDRLLALRTDVERFIETLTDGPNSLINTLKSFISAQRDYVNKAKGIGYHVRKAGIQE